MFYADIKNDVGESMAGLNLRSQIRTSDDTLIAELDVTEADGRYVFKADSTDGWPIGTLYMDIRKEEDGETAISPTIKITVAKEVTKNE